METKYIRTIEIYAKEIKNDKQCFISATTQISGVWYKVKFTKECLNNPRTKGIYRLTINFDDCSIEKGEYYENKKGEIRRGNSIIWINKILRIEKKSDEELKEDNRKAFEEIFNKNTDTYTDTDAVRLGEVNTDNELPF